MSERFIKFIPSEEALYLQKYHPNAFLLLCYIARRTRRTSGSPDGLQIGEAFIGDYEEAGIKSERKYRTAKDVLERMRIIKIVETCRNRTRKKLHKVLKTNDVGNARNFVKKSTTETTTKGTKVKLLKSTIWDINEMDDDDLNDERPTTDRRPTDDEQEVKNVKKEQEVSVLLAREHARLLKDDLYTLAIRLKKDWTQEEIEAAWLAYENCNKENIDQEHIAYITGIINKKRILTQNSEKIACSKNQQINNLPKEVNSMKNKSENVNEFYSENDTSESPLAIFARQLGLNSTLPNS